MKIKEKLKTNELNLKEAVNSTNLQIIVKTRLIINKTKKKQSIMKKRKLAIVISNKTIL